MATGDRRMAQITNPKKSRVKAWKRSGVMALLYNHKNLMKAQLALNRDIVYLKSDYRSILHRQQPMGWMVQVYNGEDYVHHSSYYSAAAAFKGMHTAAFNSKYGYAMVIDKNNDDLRKSIKKIVHHRMTEAPFGQSGIYV